jgi:hypothetical protein
MIKCNRMFMKYVNVFVRSICGWCTSSGGTTFAWSTNSKQRKISKIEKERDCEQFHVRKDRIYVIVNINSKKANLCGAS